MLKYDTFCRETLKYALPKKWHKLRYELTPHFNLLWKTPQYENSNFVSLLKQREMFMTERERRQKGPLNHGKGCLFVNIGAGEILILVEGLWERIS